MTPHYRQSFILALTGHLLLIVAAVVMSVLPGCRRHKPIDLSAFENIDITKIDSFDKLERKKPPSENVPPPPMPMPTDVPDPKVPDDPVPVKPRPPDPVPVKPPDRTEDTKPDRAPPHDPIKPAPVKPQPVASNRTTAVAVPVKVSNVRTMRVLNTSGAKRPVTVRPLTPGELNPLGNLAAPLGASNSVPMDERQRCLLLIKKALYDVWDRPTLADAGRQPAMLQIRFNSSGRVVGYQIAQPSGSESMDRSVLMAAKTVVRVDGLTPGFLNEFSTLTVEFTVTE